VNEEAMARVGLQRHRKKKQTNMFRATVCSPSGGQIVQVEKEPLLNLHTGRSLIESTIPDDVIIHSDLLMMSTELLETCGGLK
jgi:hypothetical protein